jgi:hypothetical protein
VIRRARRSAQQWTAFCAATRLDTRGRPDEDQAIMQRFEVASLALVPGQLVRAKVLGHQPWGVSAEISGHERVGASIDMIAQFGRRTANHEELLALFPPVGAEVSAVVQEVNRFSPPAWVRLGIRPEDLESFHRRCAFCGEEAVLSAGGEGVTVDIRSNDGPGSCSLTAHRECLANLVVREDTGDRARITHLGRNRP